MDRAKIKFWIPVVAKTFGRGIFLAASLAVIGFSAWRVIYHPRGLTDLVFVPGIAGSLLLIFRLPELFREELDDLKFRGRNLNDR